MIACCACSLNYRGGSKPHDLSLQKTPQNPLSLQKLTLKPMQHAQSASPQSPGNPKMIPCPRVGRSRQEKCTAAHTLQPHTPQDASQDAPPGSRARGAGCRPPGTRGTFVAGWRKGFRMFQNSPAVQRGPSGLGPPTVRSWTPWAPAPRSHEGTRSFQDPSREHAQAVLWSC